LNQFTFEKAGQFKGQHCKDFQPAGQDIKKQDDFRRPVQVNYGKFSRLP